MHCSCIVLRYQLIAAPTSTMSCVCSVKRLVGIRRMATSVSVACERLYLSHSLGITTRTLRCRRLSFEKCSNVSTSSQSPFDPDVHLVPSEANNAAHISPHHRAPTASTVSSIWQKFVFYFISKSDAILANRRGDNMKMGEENKQKGTNMKEEFFV